MTTFNATTPSLGQSISNGNEDRDREKRGRDKDKGDAEIVTEVTYIGVYNQDKPIRAGTLN